MTVWTGKEFRDSYYGTWPEPRERRCEVKTQRVQCPEVARYKLSTERGDSLVCDLCMPNQVRVLTNAKLTVVISTGGYP